MGRHEGIIISLPIDLQIYLAVNDKQLCYIMRGQTRCPEMH
jgi:hypothetical protein